MNLFKLGNLVINLDQVIGMRFLANTTNESGDEPARLVIVTTERQQNGENGVIVLEGAEAEKAWDYICGDSAYV